MEIILLEDVVSLGYKDDIIKVKGGYARNYLIPKGVALVATPGNKKSALERKEQQQLKFEKLMGELKAVAKKLQENPVKVGAKTGTSGKIFGSVTTVQIADAISEQTGIALDRKNIRILEEVKSLGTFKAEIELHREVKEEISFEVVSE